MYKNLDAIGKVICTLYLRYKEFLCSYMLFYSLFFTKTYQLD